MSNARFTAQHCARRFAAPLIGSLALAALAVATPATAADLDYGVSGPPVYEGEVDVYRGGPAYPPAAYPPPRYRSSSYPPPYRHDRPYRFDEPRYGQYPGYAPPPVRPGRYGDVGPYVRDPYVRAATPRPPAPVAGPPRRVWIAEPPAPADDMMVEEAPSDEWRTELPPPRW